MSQSIEEAWKEDGIAMSIVLKMGIFGNQSSSTCGALLETLLRNVQTLLRGSNTENPLEHEILFLLPPQTAEFAASQISELSNVVSGFKGRPIVVKLFGHRNNLSEPKSTCDPYLLISTTPTNKNV